MLSIMAQGFTYADAWHMSMREWRRYTALAAAWSIPPDERAGTVFRPTSANDEGYY